MAGTRKPSVLITEDLRHTFTFNKPKGLNRRLSEWVKGALQDRVEFKALAEGFRHQQVSPAYGSQGCPRCDFVDERNRSGDPFKCLYPRCGYEGHADRIAAMNYKQRIADPEITRYTPYRKIKEILLPRFDRRLESAGRGSIVLPGRTSEAVEKSRSVSGCVGLKRRPHASLQQDCMGERGGENVVFMATLAA